MSIIIGVHPDLQKLYDAIDDAPERVPCENDPDLFFSERNGDPSISWEMARWACNNCPVRQQCLEYAVKHEAEFGYWGGTTPKDRQRLRVKIGLPARSRLTGESVN